MNRTEENARRLINVLVRHADSYLIKRLALLLDYQADQLETDIQALAQFAEQED